MTQKIKLTYSKIISNTKIKANYFKLVIEAPDIAKVCLPGQFLQLRVGPGTVPLLRRPFSIHRVAANKKHLEILYEVLGNATTLLSSLQPKRKISILGPLGNGFKIGNRGFHILVAGGMGVAPLSLLAERIIRQNPKSPKPLVLLGARAKNMVLCYNDFKRLGCNIKIATDDGSSGFRGRVTDLLKKYLSDNKYRTSTIYACGPQAMYKELSIVSRKYNLPTQVSLETYMACGIGVCLGCTVKTQDGYKLACKDGPVFNMKEIVWA